MYKIEVNRNTCNSCQLCYTQDPVHFEADRGNKSAVVDGSVDGISSGRFEDELIGDAKNVAKRCPVSAIIITENL